MYSLRPSSMVTTSSTSSDAAEVPGEAEAELSEPRGSSPPAHPAAANRRTAEIGTFIVPPGGDGLPSCQGGAHRAGLRASQRPKCCGLTLCRSELRVHRDGDRAAAIRGGRHELRVTQRVTRVAPNRAAASLIAENAETS